MAQALWVPSKARTLGVAAPMRPLVFSLEVATQDYRLMPKSAGATQDYTIDYSGVLDADGDALVGRFPPKVSFLPSADIAIGFCFFTPTALTFSLGGGTPGEVVHLIVAIRTSGDRTRTDDFSVQITTDGPAAQALLPPVLPDGFPIPPNSLTNKSGAFLTYGAGQPLMRRKVT